MEFLSPFSNFIRLRSLLYTSGSTAWFLVALDYVHALVHRRHVGRRPQVWCCWHFWGLHVWRRSSQTTRGLCLWILGRGNFPGKTWCPISGVNVDLVAQLSLHVLLCWAKMEFKMRLTVDFAFQFCPRFAHSCNFLASSHCTVSNYWLVWLDCRLALACISVPYFVCVLLFIFHLLQAIFCTRISAQNSRISLQVAKLFSLCE